jgi:integrase
LAFCIFNSQSSPCGLQGLSDRLLVQIHQTAAHGFSWNDPPVGRYDRSPLIGAKARVVVHSNAKTGKVKYASAHDLRRSFGTRWAKKVMPAVLQKLMRHEMIATTMEFYVDIDCDEIAEQLYSAPASDRGADHTTSIE